MSRNNRQSRSKEEKRISHSLPAKVFPVSHRSREILPKSQEKMDTNMVSRDKISSRMLQSSQDILRRGVITSPLGQLGTQSLQIEDLQRQMMKNSQEYWWKSGYIEGLRRKLSDDARKPAFSVDSVFQGISSSNDGHLLTSKDNRGPASKAGDLKVSQGTNGISEGKVRTNPRHLGIPQDTNRGQVRASGSQMNTNIEQTGISRNINGRSGTTRVQIGTLRSEKGAKKGDTGISRSTNIGQRRISQERNSGQTRITDSQVGRNIGRSGTTHRQSGISNGQIKTPVDRNTGQLRTSQGRNRVQTRMRRPQLGTNDISTKTTHSHMGTNLGQWRTSKDSNTGQWRTSKDSTRGQSRISDSQMAKNTGQSGTFEKTNGRQWRAFMDSITGHTRTTEGQSETTNGQSSTTDGQSGSSGGQPGTSNQQSGNTESQSASAETSSGNGAVEQENAEISKTRPGKQSFVERL